MPSACLIIPVKRFALAKSRLAATLAPHERRVLAWTMVRCVLHGVIPAKVGASAPWSVVVVTDEPEVIDLANTLGIAVLAEPRERTLEAALQTAATTLTRLGFERLATSHASIRQT
jgi:2-phospho-L-lactate/phosphoenolpyruvate guanylyltransferase